MKRDVIISMRGRQHDGEGMDETIELVTHGVYSDEAGVKRLEYEETDISGTEGTYTTILVQGDKVSVNRAGSMVGHMQLIEGQKYVSSMDTPVGLLEFGFFPTQVKTAMQEDQGVIDLIYQLDLDGTPIGTNHLYVTYRGAEHE